jgi:succinate-semialdehyde dehydrogenase/glutarate-semialdehyde dehydrogenase
VSVNPATGAIIKSYPIDNERKVEKVLRQSVKTYEEWRMLSPGKRAIVLRNIAKEIRKEKHRLVALAVTEMGKPVQQGYYEVEKCAATMEFYAKEGSGFLKDEVIATNASKSYVSFQPIGTVLAVMPWNFPFWQVFRAMAPAVMAGNVMVLKHASNVSGCALAIAELIIRAGAPEGLLQTLLLPSSRVEGLINDSRIAAVTLTGSTAAGSKVAEAAGRNLKKVVLELGGSDAYVILADADMDIAVEIAVRGRLVNSGQSCIAAKRFVVVKSVRKEFERLFTQKMSEVTFVDPFDEKSRIGPMARVDLRDELHQQVLRSIAKGAKLLCGGFIPEGKGAFYPATVLTNVKKGMPAYDEEMFGPVGVIIEAKDTNDAMHIANDSIYGLGGGIISKNIKKAERLAATELQAGNCFVNDFVHSDPHLPFGGIKHSGYGRELGSYGIREFVNIKTVFIK